MLRDVPPWMESASAKIARAREHFHALDHEIIEFIKATKRHFVFKVNEERTVAWIVSSVEEPHPPIRISVMVGDCLFNMRSALDNLVCGLVRRQDDPASTC